MILRSWTRTLATLWTGDLLFVDRVPALDGSILGWLSAIPGAEGGSGRARRAGSWPGGVPWPASLDPAERYLSAIVRDMRALLAHGGTIEQAVATVG